MCRAGCMRFDKMLVRREDLCVIVIVMVAVGRVQNRNVE